MTEEKKEVSEIHVDVDYLKEHNKDKIKDALLRHLEYYRGLCFYNKGVYTDYAKTSKKQNDVFSLNALAYSTALGILSSVGSQSDNMRYAGMALSGMLTIISGAQRFFGFAEKSENARLIAKGFDKIVRDIDMAIMYVNSDAVKINSKTFTKIIEEIQRNIASVSEQAIQSPTEYKTKKPPPKENVLTRLKSLSRINTDDAACRHSRNNSPVASDDDEEPSAA